MTVVHWEKGQYLTIILQVRVNGPDAAPLYKFLKASKPGLFGSRIKWNFTKFLVDKNGKVINRYATATAPFSFEVYLPLPPSPILCYFLTHWSQICRKTSWRRLRRNIFPLSRTRRRQLRRKRNKSRHLQKYPCCNIWQKPNVIFPLCELCAYCICDFVYVCRRYVDTTIFNFVEEVETLNNCNYIQLMWVLWLGSHHVPFQVMLHDHAAGPPVCLDAILMSGIW